MVRIKSKIIIFVLSILLLETAISFAGPTVTGIFGTLTHGSTVTIAGSGFGTKSVAKPLVWANFENWSINPTNLGTMTTWSGIKDFSLTASNQPVNSTLVASGEYFRGIDKQGPNLRVDYNYYQKIYVSLKRYRDYVYYDTINQKFFRLWPDGGYINDFLGEYLAGGKPDQIGRCYTENVDEPGKSYQGTIFTPNKWEIEEFQWSQNSIIDATDGIWRFWRDGGLIQTRNDLRGRSTAQHGNITKLFIDNFSGGLSTNMPPDGSKVYVDDIYIDNTWSRVVAGNASTWIASTQREMQIPSAWSANSITITANQGSFTNGQSAYLYVVDANGNVNANGYPITFGASLPPPDTTLPARPKRFRIKNK